MRAVDECVESAVFAAPGESSQVIRTYVRLSRAELVQLVGVLGGKVVWGDACRQQEDQRQLVIEV
jgi:hypothetical protein